MGFFRRAFPGRRLSRRLLQRGPHRRRSTRAGLPSRRFGRERPGFESLESRRLLTGDPVANSASLAAEQTASQSINAFGMDLYAQLQSTQGGNLVDSPFSIAAALAMAYAGARGETATQMASVLHLTQDPAALASAFGALLTDLNAAGQAGGYTLDVADALWAQQGFPFVADYLKLLQSDFQGGLHQADFQNATEAARQEINDWVSQQTNGKIADLFPPGSLTPDTVLALTNAIYMNANWSVPFDASETRDASFTLASGDQVAVPTMHDAGQFRYMQRDGFQVLELPYGDGRLAMDIVLPTANDGLSSIAVNRIPADLNAWLQGLSPQSVAVSLPKFQLTTGFGLRNALSALGMPDAFQAFTADFTGIGPSHLSIGSAEHKAFINVDEAGTEAAAATGIGIAKILAIVAMPDPVVFNADHPFLFLIRDTTTGALLFTGQVENPTQQGSDPSAPVITQPPKSEGTGAQNPVTQEPVQQPIAVTPPIEIVGPVAPPIGSAPTNPTAVKHSYVLSESNSGSATAADGLLVGASDPQGDPLIAQIVAPPAHGKLVLNPDGSFTYTADAGFAGIDSFTYQASNGSHDSSPETTTIVSFQASIIDKLYNQILHRDADSQGLKYWLGQVLHGASYGTIASGILLSDEHLAPLIESYYRQFLLRPADASGLADWQRVWQAAGGPEPVIAGMIASPEFLDESAAARPHLSPDAAWVTALYERLLNREPDSGGLQYWTSKLAAGTTTPAQAVNGIQDSPESFQNLATGFFNEYLNRAPDAGELASYVAQLEAGESDEQLQIELIDTPEYANTPPQPLPGSMRQLS